MSVELKTKGKVAEIRYLPSQEELNNQPAPVGRALIPGHNISFPITCRSEEHTSELQSH